MDSVNLGKSDLNVSKIILGTWAIGGTMWSDYDENNSVKAIEAAIDNGVNTIDTAPAYGAGHAEVLIGSVIAGKRDKVIIASKCGLDIENGMRKNLKSEFIRYDLEQSLKRLNTDYIDLYQIHWPDSTVNIEDTVEALMKLKDEGKIKYAGLCNYTGAQLEAAVNCGGLVSLQPNYSLLERGIEKGDVPFCIEKGIGIITYGSLGAGMLTGKYREHPQFRKNDARSFFYRFFKKQYWPAVKAVVDALINISQQRGVTPGQAALAWNLAKPGISAAIVGARSAEQMLDNIGGASLVLSPDEVTELDRVSENIYS